MVTKKPIGEKKKTLGERWRNWRAYRKETARLRKEIRKALGKRNSANAAWNRCREEMRTNALRYGLRRGYPTSNQTPKQKAAYEKIRAARERHFSEEWRYYNEAARLEKQLAEIRMRYGYKPEAPTVW